MTTFNTGNALGSTDPRDLYDNAENLDNLTNGDNNEYADRRGNNRQSWAGMESEFNADQAARELAFNNFLSASGYEFLGEYAGGIEVTTYSQIIRESGEFWRAAASTSLPYTTTGSGMPEGGAFVSVGDANLRQELGSGIRRTDSLSILRTTTGRFSGDVAYMVGRTTAGDGGEGKFRWDGSDLSGTLVTLTAPTESVDDATDTITDTGHGLSNGDGVTVDTTVNGLTANELYWVVGATTDTYQLSETFGGLAVDLTGTTNFTVYRLLDPLQGVYICDDRTGAGGAWVRGFIGPVLSEWFGAQPGQESGQQIQNMLNFCGDSQNLKSAVLGYHGKDFVISRSLVLSHRHNGVRFSCEDAWLNVPQGTEATLALRFMIGKYETDFVYYPGEDLGTTVEDIRIGKLNVKSDAPVAAKAKELFDDDTTLLPENGGTEADYDVASTAFQDFFVNNNYNTGGGGLSYSPSIDPSTTDLSIDKFRNITVDECNFVDLARSGFSVAAQSEGVTVGLVRQNGCIFHPVSTTIPAELTSNADFQIAVKFEKIDVENTFTVFDFTAETKGSSVPHGNIIVTEAIGRKIRGRTKTHGCYEGVYIGKLDVSVQTGGKRLGRWAPISALESRNVKIREIYSDYISYSTANNLVYVNEQDYEIIVRVDQAELDIPVITGAQVPALFYVNSGGTEEVKINVGRVATKGQAPKVLQGTNTTIVTISEVVVDSSETLANEIFEGGAKNLNIGVISITAPAFDAVTTPIFLENGGVVPKITIGTLSLFGFSPATDSGVIVTTIGETPDVSIGNLCTEDGHSLRTLVRPTSVSTARCGIVMCSNLLTDAGLQFPVENPEYCIFAEKRIISETTKPAYVWRDESAGLLRWSTDRPADQTDGTSF